ncbi:hypothetical protein K4F52_003136 [Lecanicillium sp. MT-2017a]|nr:hypothetical protein K4F52_003136 [Lecanicillium sp. MT-2017a]
MADGLEHIRAFGWQSNLITEGMQALGHSQKPYYYKLAIKRWLELAIDCINLALGITLVVFATTDKKATTQPAVGLSLLCLVTYGAKLNLAVSAWIALETALSGVARLRAFAYQTPSEDRSIQDALPERWPNTGRIVFSDVTTSYNRTDRVPELNDVSFTIQGGQKVGISGRSGSGKTSMLMAMLRLVEYTGTISIDGIDISTIPPRLLRSRITTVSQDSIKLDGSVRENILPFDGQMEDETITEHILLEALDQVDLTEVIENRGGIDAPLSAMDFSGGQMQLLCLARAIVHNTCTQSRVVILDEATSNLDLETDSMIQGAIRDAFLDCTILMVSHRSESLWDSNVRLDVRNKGVVQLSVPRRPQTLF